MIASAGVPAVAAALLLAQSGLAGDAGTPVEVTPAVGAPSTIFTVSFTAPVRTGVVGSIRLRDQISAATTSAGPGCLTQISLFVRNARRGERMHVRLDPKALGGSWCAGVYHARLLELQTLVCPRGAMCPTYVRLRTRAQFSLVVRSP